LVLTGFFLWQLTTHSTPRSQAPELAATQPPIEATVRNGSTRNPSPSLLGSITPAWKWASIESEDYRRYIANLRSIECPERVIRDIILADLNKLYEPKEAPFKDPPPTLTQPWDITSATAAKANDAKSRRDAYERRKQLREIEKEKAAVVKELLGETLPLSPLRSWGAHSYALVESALDGLPPDKRERAREIYETYWEASDRLSEAFENKRTPDFMEQYRKQNELRRNTLQSVLSPEEFSDFEMRSSAAAQRLGTQVAGLHLSEDEFKAIYQARAAIEEPFGGTIPLNQLDPKNAQQVAVLETTAAEVLKSTLGEERLAQFQKSQDPNWQMLSKLKTRFELSDDAVEKAFELQKSLLNSTATVNEPMNRLQELQRNLVQAGNANPEALESIQNQLQNVQAEVAERAQQIETQRQRALSEISGLIGEKAGSVFAARNGGPSFSVPRNGANPNTTRRTIRSVDSSPPVILPTPVPAPNP